MKICRFIFAIPLAIVASLILPIIYKYILNYFIPWDFANEVIDNYLIPFFAGSIIIGTSYLIAPRFKFIYATITFVLCLIAIYVDLTKSNTINYIFILGCIFGLIIICFDFFKKNDEYSFEETIEIKNKANIINDDKKIKRSALIRKRSTQNFNNKNIEISEEELDRQNLKKLCNSNITTSHLCFYWA